MLTGLSASTTLWELMLPLAIMGGGMGLAMMPLGTHVLASVPRNLVSRVTSLTGACQNVVASLAIATFATLLQANTLANANGGTPTLEVQAAAFGSVYGAAVVVVILAAAMALTLRHTATPKDARHTAHEPVSAAI
jgi:hypothetical protein